MGGFLAWIAIQPLRIQCIALAKIWTHNKNTIWLHRRLFILGKGQEIVICMPSTFYKQWTYSTLNTNTHHNERQFIYFSKLLLGNSIFLRSIRNCSAFNFVVRFCALFQNADELW